MTTCQFLRMSPRTAHDWFTLPPATKPKVHPAHLDPGAISRLKLLDLSGNALTGSIPAVLGDLPGLATLRLSGNSLSGCIPVALRDLETNDLAALGISFCDMLTPPPLAE